MLVPELMLLSGSELGIQLRQLGPAELKHTWEDREREMQEEGESQAAPVLRR